MPTMPDKPKHDPRFPYLAENYAAFEKLLPRLAARASGKYAVVANGALVGVFDTLDDADRVGSLMVESQEYIIQRINGPALDLGVYSRMGW